uniref:Leucine-rich repeat-containing N-terminal plant-type domain-containing protein n=1 Tax=Grammatophora oceanica TaxID=210454 RepID=A0A7S1VC73_9STRA|mmetsp:Transcript_42622/g.63237  ORF Transcript_42622/g.63237 Transcript_42622/m.63237 type:complete len:403 (+) Transcript_42622:10-1218(+)
MTSHRPISLCEPDALYVPTSAPAGLSPNPDASSAPTLSNRTESGLEVEHPPTMVPVMSSPTLDPSVQPSILPTVVSSSTPSHRPSSAPSLRPTTTPPTLAPTTAPTTAPPTPGPTTLLPTLEPTQVITSDTTLLPTPSTTAISPAQQESAWIGLIQSRMPSILFDDKAGSPQRRAMDWMLQDSFSLSHSDDHDRMVQRFALAVLFFATNGPYTWITPSSGWLDNSDLSSSSSTDECEWEHVGCSTEEQGVVDRLELSEQGLSGRLPNEIGLLSSLTDLNLLNNNIEGTLPSEIGLLTIMRWFSVANNKITGTLPSHLSLNTKLTYLDVPYNLGLTGQIPDLEPLSNLQLLYLFETDLTGTIPSSLCQRFLVEAYIDCGELECDCCDGWNETQFSPCPPPSAL